MNKTAKRLFCISGVLFCLGGVVWLISGNTPNGIMYICVGMGIVSVGINC